MGCDDEGIAAKRRLRDGPPRRSRCRLARSRRCLLRDAQWKALRIFERGQALVRTGRRTSGDRLGQSGQGLPKRKVMPLVFVIPGPLREFAGNRGQIRVKGKADSLSAALSLLWAQCPGLRDRVVTETGEVRQHVNIFIDSESIRYTGG